MMHDGMHQYWHHPPFSSPSERSLVDMLQNAMQIAAYGYLIVVLVAQYVLYHCLFQLRSDISFVSETIVLIPCAPVLL